MQVKVSRQYKIVPKGKSCLHALSNTSGKMVFSFLGAITGGTMSSALPCPIAQREIHFWFLKPHEVSSSSLFKAYRSLLSTEECNKIDTIQDSQLRKTKFLSHVLRRTTISRYTKYKPQSLLFQNNLYGKPELLWPSKLNDSKNVESAPLFFNISHTSSMIACAVTLNSSIGIDIEEKGRKLRRLCNFQSANHRFSLPELHWLQKFEDVAEKHQKIIQLWTLKEAYAKARGTGIGGAGNFLKEFSILFGNTSKMKDRLENNIHFQSQVDTISLASPQNDSTKWQFILFQLCSHYASVCVEESGRDEDELNDRTDLRFNMKVWKTIPLEEDKPVGWEQTLACSTSFQ